jgi:hypothetical protein
LQLAGQGGDRPPRGPPGGPWETVSGRPGSLLGDRQENLSEAALGRPGGHLEITAGPHKEAPSRSRPPGPLKETAKETAREPLGDRFGVDPGLYKGIAEKTSLKPPEAVLEAFWKSPPVSIRRPTGEPPRNRPEADLKPPRGGREDGDASVRRKTGRSGSGRAAKSADLLEPGLHGRLNSGRTAVSFERCRLNHKTKFLARYLQSGTTTGNPRSVREVLDHENHIDRQ